MPTVVVHPDVLAWLDEQQPDLAQRIRDKLRRAGEKPDHFLTRLQGRDTYRLRIGDYRAEIEWDKQADELRVVQIGHRDGFYQE